MVTPYWIFDAGLTKGSTGFSGQSRAGFEAYVAAAREVATSFGVYLVGAYTAMRDGGGPALLSDDGVQPLDSGHIVIARAVMQATRPMSSSDVPFVRERPNAVCAPHQFSRSFCLPDVAKVL